MFDLLDEDEFDDIPECRGCMTTDVDKLPDGSYCCNLCGHTWFFSMQGVDDED